MVDTRTTPSTNTETHGAPPSVCGCGKPAICIVPMTSGWEKDENGAPLRMLVPLCEDHFKREARETDATSRGWSVIPVGRNKKPSIETWREYQTRVPTTAERSEWFGATESWAVVTGKISQVVVIDFDAGPGVETMKRLGIKPHIQTGGGGFHLYVKYPGWRVSTVNSKSKALLRKRGYVGVDIRGDGGYAVLAGRNRKGIFHAASKRRREVKLTAQLRKLTEDAVADLHRLVETGTVPPAVFKPACEECSLYRICLPEVTSRPGTVAQAAAELFRT